MAEIVKLRLTRSRAARRSEAPKAAESRASRGIGSAEREQGRYRREQIDRALDGAEIGGDPVEDNSR